MLVCLGEFIVISWGPQTFNRVEKVPQSVMGKKEWTNRWPLDPRGNLGLAPMRFSFFIKIKGSSEYM